MPQPENGATLYLRGLSNLQVRLVTTWIGREHKKKIKTPNRQVLTLADLDLLFPIISGVFSLKATTSTSPAGFDPSPLTNLTLTFGVFLNKCPEPFLEPNLLYKILCKVGAPLDFIQGCLLI